MKCKDLFKNSNVEFVPVEENLQRQESQITTYANYHGLKIEMSLGIWVNAATAKAERVLRLEFVGVVDTPRYKSRYQLDENTIKKREEKINLIKKLLKDGKKETEIAKVFKCSRQAINQFIRYYLIKD